MARITILIAALVLSSCAVIQNPDPPFIRTDSGAPYAMIIDKKSEGFHVYVSSVDERPTFLEMNRGVYYRADISIIPGERSIGVLCSNIDGVLNAYKFNTAKLKMTAVAGEIYTITCSPDNSMLVAQYEIKDKSGRLVSYEISKYVIRKR